MSVCAPFARVTLWEIQLNVAASHHHHRRRRRRRSPANALALTSIGTLSARVSLCHRRVSRVFLCVGHTFGHCSGPRARARVRQDALPVIALFLMGDRTHRIAPPPMCARAPYADSARHARASETNYARFRHTAHTLARTHTNKHICVMCANVW